MKNVLNIKMKIPHTYYLLQIKITEYISEINSSTISESSCPLENVTNPHTFTIDVFCIFVQYTDLRILLPCYCHLIHLWLHFITKSSTFLYSTISRSFVWAYKTFFKQLLAVLQWISHGRFSPREAGSPRRRGQKCAWGKQGINASEALH